MGKGKREPIVQACRSSLNAGSGAIALIAAAMFAAGCSVGSQSNASPNSRLTNKPLAANISEPQEPVRVTEPEIALNGNLSERTEQKRKIDLPVNGQRPEPQHFEAPEDSTITTSMNAAGHVTEMRVFKMHPQLAKVESVWTGPTNRQIKLFLRDGNMRELTTDKVPNLRELTAAEFLELAGIHAKQPAGDKGETSVKKRQ